MTDLMHGRGVILLATGWLISLMVLVPSFAQDGLGDPPAEPFGLGAFGATAGPAVSASLVANVAEVAPNEPFRLGVKFTIPETTYIYYRNPGSTGLPPTIKLTSPAGVDVGDWNFPLPKTKYTTIDGAPTLVSHIYKKDTVIWTEVKPTGKAIGDQLAFTARVMFQYCNETTCFPPKPVTLTLTIPVAAATKPSESADLFDSAARQVPGKPEDEKNLRITPKLSQKGLRAGDKATLTVELTIDPEHKMQVNQPADQNLISTDVVLDPTPHLTFTLPGTYPPGQPSDKPGLPPEYRGRVVVSIPVEAGPDLAGQTVRVAGHVSYQICTLAGTCYRPTATAFAVEVPVLPAGAEVAVTTNSEPTPPVHASPVTPTTDRTNANSVGTGAVDRVLGDDPLIAEAAGASLGNYLFLAFLGGFILNFMPCVLPVIAFKVFSFVEQAGESRGRIFALNLSYVAGTITVFLILATVAVVLGRGWGSLFGQREFVICMTALVLIMALWLLGIFEMPIPGFSGAHRTEGLTGAFFTGVIATLLGTPCTGPFMGVTLGWALTQPPTTVYLIFATMGLGMGSPYLIFGLIPGAVRLLPKPGAWMHTFKQIAGLVLLATVVFLLSTIESTLQLPVLAVLIAVGVGAWIEGHFIDFTATTGRAVFYRSIAGLIVAAAAWFAFGTWYPAAEAWRQREIANLRSTVIAELDNELADQLPKPLGELLAARAVSRSVTDDEKTPDTAIHLPWERFSDERLEVALKEGKTVLVDFTANWCVNCKVNESLALNRKPTLELIERNRVVTLMADYTKFDENITRWLRKFRTDGIPLTVIFPAHSPDQPIVLRDLFTMNTVLESLEKAGPSR